MNVSDVMKRDVITVNTEDTVGKAAGLMVENRVHQLPVLDDKMYHGMVYFKNLIETNVFPNAKIHAVSVRTSSIHPEAEVWKAAKTVIGSGLRALPVIAGRKLVGIVSETDLALAADVGDLLVDEVLTGAIVVEVDSTLNYALSIMRRQNISRLPVVNKDSKLVGVIDMLDIMRVLKAPRERLSASRTTTLSAGPRRTDLLSMHVRELMRKPTTVRPGTRLADAVKLLERAEEIIVAEKEMPVGVIVPKDVVKISMPERRGPIVQIAHMEDEDLKQEILMELDKFLKRVSGMFDRVYSLDVAVDKHRTRKYSMHGKLMTTEGVVAAKASAWDVRSASRELANRMERRIKSYRKPRRRPIEERR